MKRIKSFFKGVKKETKMVRWPDTKKLAKYSFITVCMLGFFGIYFYLLDAIFSVIRGLF